jgi:DMSO/TMAO reductase YedYZ molybdopterin-dependent catalytic subunit
VGETIAPLRRLAVLAPRNPAVGPQSVPVNQTALQAGVVSAAADTGYRLTVSGRCRRPLSLSVPQLQALPQRISALPITCVEGWSADAVWRGVPLGSLLALAEAPPGASVRVESLQDHRRLYSSSVVDSEHADDPDTLLALELNGDTLDLDHGYPVRLIAPDRPGVLQTKWISKVVVL